jgi:hypothetical protein
MVILAAVQHAACSRQKCSCSTIIGRCRKERKLHSLVRENSRLSCLTAAISSNMTPTATEGVRFWKSATDPKSEQLSSKPNLRHYL